ncbi:ATP-binding protein [Deltaproteobacteria bacterium OttesenSCG-928-M10]|nr:ATP-binding protein [Deltaproteobacteria bacterium OttesenSCG-928-M10]
MPEQERPAGRKRPGLRLIMLLVGMIIMIMPISGLYLFRIYENELVRQTEAELIAQSALVGAMFKAEIMRTAPAGYGQKLPGQVHRVADYLEPRLDLSRDEILPRGVSFRASPYEPEPAASEAAARFQAVIDEAADINLSSIMILDYHGLMVGGGRRGLGLSLADNFEVAEALSGQAKSVLRERASSRFPLASRSRGTGFRVFLAMPVMNGDRLLGVVYLSRTPRDILKALHNERRNVLWAAALSAGLVAVVTLIVSLMIIRPIRRLAEDAKKVAEGRSQGFSPEAHPIVARELAELRARVAEMAARLSRRSEYLKAFASGVSHEFKTPLTSIRGAMELMADHGAGMDPATRTRFEANIMADLDRLERLVGRLLALARAEARAEGPAESDRTDASALSKRLAELYREQGFMVLVDGPAEPLLLSVPEDVLETAVRNLFDNGRDAGATAATVELYADPARGQGVVAVIDNGPGIAPEAAESIFKPFFTTRKNKGGTGLGLALARTMLTPHRGDIFWDGNEPGAVFIITLPLAQ